MDKRFTFVLVLVLASSSLIMVKPAQSSTTKPSVPEFTVSLVDHSYDVPTTYSIDPYTGENVTHPGHHVENKSIEVRIKNQPFTPYWIQENENNWTINFFYNIRVKGHFAQNWSYLYGGSDPYLPQDYGSEYTVVSLPPDFPSDAKVDFQVEALIGYEHGVITIPPWQEWVITGEESGWSDTQTIAIDGSAPTATPNAQQGFNWTEISLFAALGVIAALLVVIALMRRKQTKK
jgi:hypothetical protein